jgi:hypothetical protein
MKEKAWSVSAVTLGIALLCVFLTVGRASTVVIPPPSTGGEGGVAEEVDTLETVTGRGKVTTTAGPDLGDSVYIGNGSFGTCLRTDASNVVHRVTCNRAMDTVYSDDLRMQSNDDMGVRNKDGDRCFIWDKDDGLITYQTTNSCERPKFNINIGFDNNGTELADNTKFEFRVSFQGVLTGNEILCDQSGSVVFDVWKDTYANAPPTVADTITASDKPTVSSAQKSQDTNIGTWTTTFNIGDWFIINVDSATTVTRCTLVLIGERITN